MMVDWACIGGIASDSGDFDHEVPSSAANMVGVDGEFKKRGLPMVKLPIDTRLKTEKLIEDRQIIQSPRPYLGVSSLAGDCSRALWYGFRLVSKQVITARQERLFTRGHREEPVIVEDLQKIGIVHHSDQKECTFAYGHGKGHCDGILDNVPDAPKTQHLAEFKTANDKNYKAMVKNGLKASKPTYHGQMIVYMELLGLKRGLFIMVNKNDDSRYYERVAADPDLAKEYISRGIDIITTEVPPQKIGGPTWFKCKWCNHYQVCQMGEAPQVNCRTCHYCDLRDEGQWSCSAVNRWLDWGTQQLGCYKYQLMEGLK